MMAKEKVKPNIYETKIKPKFETIYRLASKGANNKEVYTALGIGKTTFNKHLKEQEELSELLKKARQEKQDKSISDIMEMIESRPTINDMVSDMSANYSKMKPEDQIKVAKFLYPELDWYQRNEIERTRLMAKEIDLKEKMIDNQPSDNIPPINIITSGSDVINLGNPTIKTKK